jgi:hypothetical protein
MDEGKKPLNNFFKLNVERRKKTFLIEEIK